VKSRLLRARGEFRGALDVLRTAATAAGRGPGWLRRELALSRTRLLLAAGRLDDAVALLGELDEPRRPDAVVVHAAARLTAGDRRAGHRRRAEQARDGGTAVRRRDAADRGDCRADVRVGQHREDPRAQHPAQAVRVTAQRGGPPGPLARPAVKVVPPGERPTA